MKKHIIVVLITLFTLLFVISLLMSVTENEGIQNRPVILDGENRPELKQIESAIKNLSIRSIDNDTLMLADIIEETKFIIYNPEIGCQPCFDTLIDATNKFSFELENKTIVLSRFYSLRDIKFFKLKNNNTPFAIYDILKTNPECILDAKEKPMAFMCDSTLSISQLFVYDPKNKNYLNAYLSGIETLLKSSPERK